MNSSPPWKRHEGTGLDIRGILIHEPFEVYRAKAKNYLTSHALADFRKCPLLYRQKQLGLIADEDRTAYQVGRAAHVLILEGRERFQAEYAVGGPVNPSTGKVYGPNTKAFAEWAEAQRKQVLTDAQFAMISRLDASVRAHPIAASLLRQGAAEGVVRAEYQGVPSQVRVDWFHPEEGICDLKTTDHLDYFVHDAKRFGYLFQVAFYQAVVRVVTGVAYPTFLIAVEKCEPYRCGVWRIEDGVLDYARRENEAAMVRLQECRRTDCWPTLYEQLMVFDDM